MNIWTYSASLTRRVGTASRGRFARCAGFTVHNADNAQNPGISAVHSRIEAGTLKMLAGACPNLVSESEL